MIAACQTWNDPAAFEGLAKGRGLNGRLPKNWRPARVIIFLWPIAVARSSYINSDFVFRLTARAKTR
jgi:hypothetical protein